MVQSAMLTCMCQIGVESKEENDVFTETTEKVDWVCW